MNAMLLAVPALLPLLGGMVLLLTSQFGPLADKIRMAEKRKGTGIISYRFLECYVEGITILNSLVLLWLIFHGGEEQFVLFRLYGELKVMFHLDSMGKVFAGLIGFLWPLAVLYSFEYMREEKRKATFFSYYLMTYGVTAGIALAGNLVTLYLFYEMLTLATFPLVLFPMTKEAVRASRKYLYYSIGGAAFAFLGLVFVLSFSATGSTEFLPGGVLDGNAASTRRNLLLFMYVLGFYGFGVKAVIFPCHKWLPPATVAPTPVTALLHAVAVVKSGAFAILRLTYFSFGTGFLRGSWAQWAVMAAAMVTIVYGSTMAVKEVHWKRRLAYSTISNLSYILLGVSMMSPLGLAAALSHMVFHGFMKICSFFCAGAVMHQTGKTYVYELDGMGQRMPVTFGCLTVASLSLVGIPLFAGFISKWNIARAAFTCAMEGSSGTGGFHGSWLAFGAVAVLLYSALMTAVYMLTVLVRAYFPKLGAAVMGADTGTGARTAANPVHTASPENHNRSGDPNWMMLVPLVLFAVVIIGLGLHSQPLMQFLMMIGGEAG
ncbi:MAG: proton-conducting transporter membrane subunit [Lachnospiraceae bacterium]|nr:proton-conducting transporter membrane subunit [Lachnospiraceae bacterium]